ncbi:MAG: cobyrinate a,c-diamide synthase [Pseudomonadota bacterium]
MNGFLVAAPHSGSGKTLITLGLLRALRSQGRMVGSAKAGPDYIDPAFHAAATGHDCINLDPWAMREDLLLSLAHGVANEHDLLVVEGMMGLFDGAADGSGSAADLATLLGLPVVMAIDASRMSWSVAALVEGFCNHRSDVNIAGVILNKVGSMRHEGMLRDALASTGVDIFGAVPAHPALEMPSRHLGLVQAGERADLEAFITEAGTHVARHCDLEALSILSGRRAQPATTAKLVPPGQRIAIARDEAFAFCYPHVAHGWREQGAEITYFSPLADKGPQEDADAVFLPGGYPELHAARISSAAGFKSALKRAARRGAWVYGECGGYMVLGEGLVDAEGTRHPMIGLLSLETSFQKRKLHLGYRQIKAQDFVLGPNLRGHEFHYSSATCEQGEPLFETMDASGKSLGKSGLRSGNTMGSYMHIIDRVKT